MGATAVRCLDLGDGLRRAPQAATPDKQNDVVHNDDWRTTDPTDRD